MPRVCFGTAGWLVRCRREHRAFPLPPKAPTPEFKGTPPSGPLPWRGSACRTDYSSYELRGLHCEVDAGTFPAGASDPGLPASATICSRPAASSEISRKLRQEAGKKKGEGRRQDDSKR